MIYLYIILGYIVYYIYLYTMIHNILLLLIIIINYNYILLSGEERGVEPTETSTALIYLFHFISQYFKTNKRRNSSIIAMLKVFR